MKLDRSQFLKELKAEYPELIERINSEKGLSTFEMDVFCDFTQKKINGGEIKEVAKCFTLAEIYFKDGNRGFRNIISTCFVECLEFTDTNKRQREWAWELIPEILKKDYIEFFGKPGI